jgi:hypothetical protein
MNVLTLLIVDSVEMEDVFQEISKELNALEIVLTTGSSTILLNVLEKSMLENSPMLPLKQLI